MSIRSQTEDQAVPSQRSDNVSKNIVNIPTCTIEDVDRAIFKLFNEQLPLVFTHRNDTQRVPIIFSTGERFALLARKKPLRDRSKALILPVISIARKNIQIGSEYGAGTNTITPHVIKKQISTEDAVYQRLLNKNGFQNSNDLVSPSALLDSTNLQGAQPGRIATRRRNSTVSSPVNVKQGDLFKKNLSNNVYEIFEMPPPVYLTAEYEVTIWTQYIQEMNNLQSAILSESHFYSSPSFKIESDNGYYFVLYMDKSFSNDNNFDDFSEEERVVRSTFSMKASGYILGSAYIGSPNRIKKYVSSPQIVFEMDITNDASTIQSRQSPVASGNASDYVADDDRTVDETAPTQSIGGVSVKIAQNENHLIGGASNAANEFFVQNVKNPFNNNVDKKVLVTKTSTNRNGETVYREIL